jgi:hypothetical protein
VANAVVAVFVMAVRLVEETHRRAWAAVVVVPDTHFHNYHKDTELEDPVGIRSRRVVGDDEMEQGRLPEAHEGSHGVDELHRDWVEAGHHTVNIRGIPVEADHTSPDEVDLGSRQVMDRKVLPWDADDRVVESGESARLEFARLPSEMVDDPWIAAVPSLLLAQPFLSCSVKRKTDFTLSNNFKSISAFVIHHNQRFRIRNTFGR